MAIHVENEHNRRLHLLVRPTEELSATYSDSTTSGNGRHVQLEEKAPDQTRSSHIRLWRIAAVLVVLATLTAGATALQVSGLGDSTDPASEEAGAPWYDAMKDTDGDGLFDAVEAKGWRTRVDGFVVTDPDNRDTDGDGLTDGLEAGELGTGMGGPSVYDALSDPTMPDTDGDGVVDGIEFYSDMDPRKRDTDGDGLSDAQELEFGSDPTLENPDNDRYSDKEEYDNGSDPMAYDLARGQAVAAFLVGAAAGDVEFLARDVGRMNDAQVESPEYLAGQIASGVLGVGDIRDLAASIGSRDPLAAVTNAAGLVPGAGDTAKAVSVMTVFAKQSPRAERSVTAAVQSLPGSKAAKQKILAKIFGTRVRLPASLAGGPKDNFVYKGDGYVGITKNFERRTREHAARGRSFKPEQIKGADGLSRGEAQAIEEACIVELGLASGGGSLENIRHSISPSHPDYEGAIAWGRDFLKKTGGTCS